MKITTDLSQALLGRAGAPHTRASITPPPHLRAQEAELSRIDRSISDRLNMERSLNEALSITQLSQSLLQKAMTVSSKLRSVAAQTIINGRTDSDALQSALSDIQSTMQQYGEHIAAPPMRQFLDGAREKAPEIGGDIERVIAATTAAVAGTVPPQGEIEAMRESLARGIEETGRSAVRIQENIREAISAMPVPERFAADRVVPSTTRQIEENPSAALNVQGNISRDSAFRLIGA